MATLWWNTRSGYRRERRAGHGDSPSRSGGGRSILWERRQPVCEEVTIGPVEGFPMVWCTDAAVARADDSIEA